MNRPSQRIAVLTDGGNRVSEARRRSGEAIAARLAEAGHDARPVFVDEHLDLALRQGQFDVAFVALGAEGGKGGSIQGLLEWLGIPYTGAGVLATALAASRPRAQEVLRLANLPTAPGYVVRAPALSRLREAHAGFGFPVVVGPANAGLSHGGAVAHDFDELAAAVEDCARFGDEILIERFVGGRVIAVAVLDGVALGAVDLGARTSRHEPAPRRRAPHPALLRIAERATAALGADGPALVELVVSERHNEIVRGVDLAPLLAPASLYGRIAASAGIAWGELCAEILQGARLCNEPRAPGPPPARVDRGGALPDPVRRGSALPLSH